VVRKTNAHAPVAAADRGGRLCLCFGFSRQHEAPSIFDSGIGDWLLDLAVLALIALVLGNVLRWAYLALVHR
jgi:hypothetical protein